MVLSNLETESAMKVCSFLLLALLVAPVVQTVRLSYPDARPIIDSLTELLPPEFKGKTADQQRDLWPKWLGDFELRVRDRLLRGDEDTLVNFLLYGTSYTSAPRLSAAEFKPVASGSPADPYWPVTVLSPATGQTINRRVADLAGFLARPVGNERALYFESLMASRRLTGGAPLQDYLRGNLARVLREAIRYAGVLESARQGDASDEFAERSTLFRDRGISLDTSLRPGFALEVACRELLDRKFLSRGAVRRVAVIGPGLEFTDKDGGYDIYPPQTLQPFAIIDTLVKLGLARVEDLEVSTVDVSPKVNRHLERARRRAQKALPYTVQLPRDTGVPWKGEYVEYWKAFGARLGTAISPARVPVALSGVTIRAVAIRPDVVLRVHPIDLNVVAGHLELPREQRFDLVIATNVFVYYDVFQQSLAVVNLGYMLRDGGLMLSNNALLELPSARLHSVGYTSAPYSDRPSDGEHIVWYRCQ
jgi:hypothetical protein